MKQLNRIILEHIHTGNVGVFIKEYKPTGMNCTTQIRLEDGRIYFAPSNEFRRKLFMTEPLVKIDIDVSSSLHLLIHKI